MANLQLQMYNSGTGVVNEGTGVAPWIAGGYAKTSWWYNGDPVNTNWFYSLNESVPDITGTAYIQYGQNIPPWASARFFTQAMHINSQTVNPDGSITANITTQLTSWAGRITDYAAAVGYAVQYTVSLNNVVVATFNGSTIDEFTYGAFPAQTFNVNVPPTTGTTSVTSMHIHVHYPNGEYPDQDDYVGFSLYNPNPPTYIPGSIWDGTKWKSLNSSPQGTLKIWNGTSWEDHSQHQLADIGVANKGFARIWNGSAWVQQNKTGL